MGCGNKSLFKWFWAHDQYGHHAHTVYGKKVFSRTKRLMTLKHGMQDRVLEFYQVCSNNDLCLTLKYLMARSNLVPCNFLWEKVKTIDFSETIVVKIGRRSKLNEYVNLYEYQRSRSFTDLGSSSLSFNVVKLLSLETAGPPCAYMVKPLKISLFGTKRLITLKLVMQYWLIDYYQIYSNDDIGMTLTYFMAVIFVPLHL